MVAEEACLNTRKQESINQIINMYALEILLFYVFFALVFWCWKLSVCMQVKYSGFVYDYGISNTIS